MERTDAGISQASRWWESISSDGLTSELQEADPTHSTAMPLREGAAPVTRIPPEILVRIFQLLADSTLQRFDKAPSLGGAAACGRETSPYSWIRISHVCQHWRDVSLASPLLWSTIVVTHHTECMQALLERSQQVPLDVRTPGGTGCYLARPVPIKSLRLVLTALQRTRTLELAINWWIYDDLTDLLQRPAPLLRKLRLTTPHGGYDGGWLCPVVSLNLHDEPAQIEELALSCYVFPWSEPYAFRTLRHLRVDNRGLSRPAIEEVAYALGRMPYLVTLTLHGVLNTGHSNTLARAKPEVIELPELEQVTLSGDSLSCSTLLKLLRLPASARMTLVYGSDRNLDALALSMPYVRQKISNGLRADSTCLSILHSQTSCNILFHHIPSHTDGFSSLSYPELESPKLSLKIAPSPDHLEAVCRHLRSDGVRVLQMTPLPGTAIAAWLTVFGHFGDFEEVRLKQWQPSDVRDLLAYGAEDQTEGGVLSEDGEDTHVCGVLPSMRTLVLTQVQFSGMAECLLDVLVTRTSRGHGVQRLVLRECNGLTSHDISSLTRAVDILDWDGKGIDHIPCILVNNV